MTRTRSEVKRILIECASNRQDCGQCPIAVDRENGIVHSDLWECTDEPLRNALEYIMELETEVRELRGGASDQGIAPEKFPTVTTPV